MIHDNHSTERYTRASRPVRTRARERGSSLILLSYLMTTVLLPMIGLAIDGSICWWMKTKLSSAVDASALAAARSLSLAASESQLQTEAQTVGTQYFNVNFPAGVMGVTISTVNSQTSPLVTVVDTNAQVITVTVQAVVKVPVYFLRILGYTSVTLGDVATSTRRNTNVMFVLDRSYSMVQAGVCSAVASNSQQFINSFVEGRDTVGLVSFQSTANLDYAPATTFKTAINNLLGQMQCTGYTTTAEALYKAYQALISLNQPNALNVIVMFTDGIPDSFVGNFPIKTYADTRYDSFNYSTYEEVPPTTCVPPSNMTITAAPTLTGVVTDTSGQPGTTGYTGGIYPDTPTAISYQSPYIVPASVITASGCNFYNYTNYPTYSVTVRQDIAYLPATDVYSNALYGTATAYKPLDYYASGGPYANLPRIDTPNSVMNAASNAANSEANTIRNSGYFIYTMGLGGTQYQPIDSDLLMRIANDPSLPSSEYNSSQPAGRYIPVNAAGIAQAFSQVESLMLHLSQ